MGKDDRTYFRALLIRNRLVLCFPWRSMIYSTDTAAWRVVNRNATVWRGRSFGSGALFRFYDTRLLGDVSWRNAARNGSVEKRGPIAQLCCYRIRSIDGVQKMKRTWLSKRTRMAFLPFLISLFLFFILPVCATRRIDTMTQCTFHNPLERAIVRNEFVPRFLWTVWAAESAS